MTTPTRVVLADDAALFRTALAELLERNGYTVVAQAGDAVELQDAVAEHRPDLAVVDIRMPPKHKLEGLCAAVAMRERDPGLGVLLLSQAVEATHLGELIGSGARGVGYLLKDRASGPDFLEAVRRVAEDGCVFDPEVVAVMVGGSGRRNELAGLTDRERDVLELMAQGMSNIAIATALHLTTKTVETHVRSIFQRLVLPEQPDQHRRVLAVLAYLRAA